MQQALFTQLKDVMNVDYRQLLARIKGLSSIKNVQTQQTVATEIEEQIQLAQVCLMQRKSAVKTIEFPENLPVSQRKAEIQN